MGLLRSLQNGITSRVIVEELVLKMARELVGCRQGADVRIKVSVERPDRRFSRYFVKASARIDALVSVINCALSFAPVSVFTFFSARCKGCRQTGYSPLASIAP